MSSSRRKVPISSSHFKSRRDRKKESARERKHEAQCRATREGSTDKEPTCPVKDAKDYDEQLKIIVRCALAAGASTEAIDAAIGLNGAVCLRNLIVEPNNAKSDERDYDAIGGLDVSDNHGGM